MSVIRALEPTPETIDGTVFMAGPTPPNSEGRSWRSQALDALQAAGYRHTVIVPECSPDAFSDERAEILAWERQQLHAADAILFWLPPPSPPDGPPAFMPVIEFGEFLNSGKLYYGRPEGIPGTRDLDQRYREETGREPASDLADLALEVTSHVGDGAERTGGERSVPLHIWRTKHFQSWLASQRAAGNRLDDARVLWQFIIPKVNFVLAFAIHVSVWVQAEQRHKANEFILGRSDLSCVIPWWRDPEDLWNSHVVLIREFRSPARTTDGFVHDLPGGSSFKGTDSAMQQAVDELKEETGLDVTPDRFEPVEARQYNGSFSTHHGHPFSIELTAEEVQDCRDKAINNTRFGNEAETELTMIEVCTLQEILSGTPCVDWSTLGIILAAIVAPNSSLKDQPEECQ